MGRWCPITPVLLGLVLVDVELVPLDGVELLFRQFQLLGAAAFFRTPGGGTWGHEACWLKVGWGDRLNDPPEGCAPPRGGGHWPSGRLRPEALHVVRRDHRRQRHLVVVLPAPTAHRSHGVVMYTPAHPHPVQSTLAHKKTCPHF